MLLVRFILNGLAGIFHVFTKTMGCVAPGKDNLTHDCDKETDGCSFQRFHFYLSQLLRAWVYNRPISARMMMMIRSNPTMPPGP